MKVGDILKFEDSYPWYEIKNVGDGDPVDFIEGHIGGQPVRLAAGTQLRGVFLDLPGMEPYTVEQKADKREWLYTVMPNGYKTAVRIPEAKS